MNAAAIQETFLAQFPGAVTEENIDWPAFQIEASTWKQTAQQLRSQPEWQCDFLFCLTCVDWKTHLTMVYHLRSTIHRHDFVIKVKLDRAQPVIDTISDIWRTAEFLEREVYELFGVQFTNHPDLRLLILPDGWEGKHPLRKDFEDPVNMIKL
jgi:NADH-quinone oxidoreductase subunit C